MGRVSPCECVLKEGGGRAWTPPSPFSLYWKMFLHWKMKPSSEKLLLENKTNIEN